MPTPTKKTKDTAALPARGPQGQKLAINLSAGNMRPGVGKLVQRTGQAQFCGPLWGTAMGYTEHPNQKDPNRVSRRFAGDFRYLRGDGTPAQATECYLPGVLERGIKAALDISRAPVDFAVEIWCEPDEPGGRESPIGYSYAVYNRRTAASHVDELAYEAGILPRPESRTLLGHDDAPHDPETGELLPEDQQPAE